MTDELVGEGTGEENTPIEAPADGTEVELPAEPQPEEGAAPGQEPSEGEESGEAGGETSES